MKKLLTLTLLAAITLMAVSCGDKEENFSCTSNTQFLVDGSSNQCGVSLLSSYQPYKEYPNGTTSAEYFHTSFSYSIGAGSVPGIINIIPESKVNQGDRYTYTSKESPYEQELLLSVGVALADGIYISHYYGSLEVIKLDRTQNLITYSFDITADYSNGNSFNVTGTVTDLYFE